MVSMAPAGTRIAGRFLVEALAGTGGMGIVYRAHDERTSRTVALKVIRASGSAREGERFARESNLLSELRHPGIVGYLAHGATEAGEPYLAMEWLEGEDLSRRLDRGALGLAESVTLLRRTAEALAVAHGRGVVHRDLKPGNLFLRDGRVEHAAILDFGIARRAALSHPITRTGAVMGTPGYMAPEQARGAPDITPAADVFSLGCVLFECLTGQPPFVAEQPMAVLAKILFNEPPKLRRVRPEMPEELEALLGRMLAKSTADRLPDATAILTALAVLDGLPLNETMELGAAAPWAWAVDTEQHLVSVLMAMPSVDPSEPPSPAEDATIDQQLDELHRALAEHGARVEVLAGGSLVATLSRMHGAATDQAAQAARCALLIRARWPGGRIVLCTGRGLLLERVPMGEVLDRAAALLRDQPRGTPPSDQILLDEVTRGLLEVRFRVHRTPSGGYALSGDELELDASRPLLGKPTPCVGRDVELAMLEGALSGCIEDSDPRAVLITAPPGAGKSRLRHEFLRRALARDDAPLVLIGRGEPMSAGSPYGMLGQALRRLCGIHDGEPLEARRGKLSQRIGERLPEAERERIVAFIGELCVTPFSDADDLKLRAARQDPLVMSDQLTQAMLDFLRAESTGRATLLVLEDLHWGDALTVKLCESALRKLETSPLMVLAFARPEVDALFPRLWSGAAQVLPLRPLSKKASERLVQQVLGKDVPSETVARIVEQSEGNALFLEELIRFSAEGRGDEAPETVLAMLQARIGRLDTGARRVLRAASVFGETSWLGGIVALLGVSEAGLDLEGWISRLTRDEILEERGESRFPEEREYRFRHALMRDAAYGLLTAGDRAAAHRLACDYLERAGGTDPAVLGEHAFMGEDLDRAARFYIEAGKQALAHFDLDASERHARRALECGVRGEQLGMVRAIQCWTAHSRMDLATGYTHAVEAIDLLRPGTFWWTKAIGICFYAFFMLGRMEHADRLILAFFEFEPDSDARVAHLEAGAILGLFFTLGGERRGCNRLVDKLTLVASSVDPLDRGHLFYTTYLRAYYQDPDPFRAVQDAQRASALFLARRDRHWHCFAQQAVGLASEALGAVARAEAALREALALARSNQDVFSVMVNHVFLGFLLAGQPDAGSQEEAVRISEEYRDKPLLGPAVHGSAHKIRARVLLKAGDLESAELSIQIALESLALILPHRMSLVPLWVELLLRQGRIAEARAAAEETLRVVDAQRGMGAYEVPLRLAATQARFADGDVEGGRSALREALAQVKLRAERIEDPELLRSYLEVTENRDIFELARAYGQS